jgi:transcriptional regulator with XRE-family HTH domain
MSPSAPTVGDLLREWRQRRRLSQLELACDAEISTRHLSFVETGRATPSREMVMNLAEHLDIPLRERNTLLLAAGFAPVFRERPLADPALQAPRHAIDLVLASHEPFPALAIDRCWNLIAANRALEPLLTGVDRALLAPPVNVIRLSLHPAGLASRIVNLAEWRGHLLQRLRRQINSSRDPDLEKLIAEVSGYPSSGSSSDQEIRESYDVLIPLRLRTEQSVFSFFSTSMVFGTPLDITLAEIAIESFFPADSHTSVSFREANSRF